MTPNRAVGSVTRELLGTVANLARTVEIDPAPQEVSWTVPLDEDDEHASYDPDRVAWGWWPGDPKLGKAAFYAYAHPAPASFANGTLSTAAARWNAELGLYVLGWDDVRASDDPHAFALEFARSAFQHACLVCGWDERLAASAEGARPSV